MATSSAARTTTATKELLTMLSILEDKVDFCRNEKKNISKKMSTKNELLKDSLRILQTDLKEALYEDAKKKRKIQLTEVEKKNEHDVIIDVMHCQGWIYDKDKIWIQAQGRAMIRSAHQEKAKVSVNQAHLSCLPNKFLPETINYNTATATYTADNSNNLLDFYIQFKVLPDVNLYDLTKELKVTCRYQLWEGPHWLVSEAYPIEWSFNTSSHDVAQQQRREPLPAHVCNSSLGTTRTNLMLLITSIDFLQAYYPHHIKIRTAAHSTFLQFIETFCDQLNNTVYANQNATLLLVCDNANGRAFDIFGLSSNEIIGMLQEYMQEKCKSSNEIGESADKITVIGDGCHDKMTQLIAQLGVTPGMLNIEYQSPHN